MAFNSLPITISMIATLTLMVGAPITATAQITFTDESVASGIAHTGESYGASWGDLNGDGLPDLFVSNHREQPSLFLNRANGTFFDTGGQVRTWQFHRHADTHGGTWSDFDNDGDQDLMVSTGEGNPNQFLVNEHQRLVDRTAERGLTMAEVGGRLPVWFDYDGDRLTDLVMTQTGGIARLFKQNPDGTFTDTTSEAQLVCRPFHYAHLLDVTGDGHLDLVCAELRLFPQKIYDTAVMPWSQVFDSRNPAPYLPAVAQVVDSVTGDFNNDGYVDMFLLSGVQLRPSSVDRSSGNAFEAHLVGGNKGFKFVSAGVVTLTAHWNKFDSRKIKIGAGGRSPTTNPIVVDPTDPSVQGMPPVPTLDTELPSLQIGFDPTLQQWTVVLQTKLLPTSPSIFSEAYLQVSSTAEISELSGTGFWPSDKPARPTLLLGTPSGFVDQTTLAGLDAPVQCVSVTAGDFDNDMDLDLYLACRSGAANIPNILYENSGNGTFAAISGAAGAAGPVGVAMASGAGTADTAVTADYDVDGFLDLFVTNGFNLRPLRFGGENKLFHNSRNGNHWIELDLVGTNSERDATGARVHATANGVTQVRVQNGGYHRWAQDMKRSHFGLGAATTVDLRVEWPSGTVETFAGVAADQLYRITEGSGMVATPPSTVPVPLYACGAPTLDGAVDAGVFLWRDCPSGEWRLKTAAAGGAVTYSGTITSTNGFTSVRGLGLDSLDSVDALTNPNQLVFTFVTTGTGTDGVNFIVPDGAATCLHITSPAETPLFFGPFRSPIMPPFNLETQVPCEGDDASARPGSIAFVSATASVTEAVGSAVLQVARTGGSTGAVSVSYSTSSGSASAGTDFTMAAGTLSWADGEGSAKTISVPIANDTSQESSESFVVTLATPTGGAILGAASATVTINDDDASPNSSSDDNGGGGGVGGCFIVGLAVLGLSRRRKADRASATRHEILRRCRY